MDTYEKKYNEALNWMRELYPGLHGATKEDAEHYFPELRESEDERVRNGLIGVVSDITGGWPFENHKITKKEAITYLEKQKDHFRDDTKKVEQKPAQTDDEKEYIRTIKSIISDFIRDKKPEDVAYYQRIYDWLDGRHIEQKLAEWSEKDADILNCCISSIEEAKENRYAYKETDGDTSYDREIDWLKSLRPVSKESLQPHWKPSNTQINYLGAAVIEAQRRHNESVNGFPRYHALRELYEQLKKLM